MIRFNRKIRKTVTVLLAAALAVASLALVSCEREYYTADELRGALEKLIPASSELNEIYFGVGLPTAADGEEAEEVDSDIVALSYAPVLPEAKYHTEAELRAATLDVFSEDYAEFLFERSFTGLSIEYDSETVVGAIYARYIESDGILTKRVGLEDEALPLGRVYLLGGMTVERTKADYALVDVPTEIDGEESTTVRLKLVMTEGGWRLDSPTY